VCQCSPVSRITGDVSGPYNAIYKVILFLKFHKSEGSPNHESDRIEPSAPTQWGLLQNFNFLLRICSIWNKLQTKKQANEPGKAAIFVIINVWAADPGLQRFSQRAANLFHGFLKFTQLRGKTRTMSECLVYSVAFHCCFLYSTCFAAAYSSFYVFVVNKTRMFMFLK